MHRYDELALNNMVKARRTLIKKKAPRKAREAQVKIKEASRSECLEFYEKMLLIRRDSENGFDMYKGWQ